MAIIVEVPKQKMIEEGEYVAVLRDVQEAQGKYGPILKFWFEITEPGYETTVSGICSKSAASPRSKLFRWLIALGADLSRLETVDVTSFIGTTVVVTVSAVTTSDGDEYLNVVDVKRANIRRVRTIDPVHTNVSGPVPEYESVPEQKPKPVSSQVSVPANNPQQQLQQQQQVRRNIQNPVQGKKNPFIEEINDLDELEF
jgi:hypothetical protein